MGQQQEVQVCSRCGESGSGRFCAGCGAALGESHCGACGHPSLGGARYCTGCGAGLAARSYSAPAAQANVPPARRETPIAWIFGGAAIVMLAAFVAGNVTGRRSPAPPVDQSPLSADAAQAPLQAGATSAPDISAMSPEERATRLFNRVMLYTEQGKTDSAKFFAPMAISAYEMMPVDAHNQYDIGVISAAVGDVARARAEADTILAARPTHLLGLVLAIKAATLGKNEADVTRYSARLVAAAPSERAQGLKEYGEHSRDIDDALAKASKR